MSASVRSAHGSTVPPPAGGACVVWPPTAPCVAAPPGAVAPGPAGPVVAAAPPHAAMANAATAARAPSFAWTTVAWMFASMVGLPRGAFHRRVAGNVSRPGCKPVAPARPADLDGGRAATLAILLRDVRSVDVGGTARRRARTGRCAGRACL